MAEQTTKEQPTQMDFDAIEAFMKKFTPWMIRNPGTKATIGDDGALAIKYAPQVVGAISEASGGSGPPAIGEGVIDPQMIMQMAGQLMQNQQQQQGFAASIPQMLSQMGQQGAQTEQIQGWREREGNDMQKAIMGIAGQLFNQQMSNQGMMDRAKLPPQWREGELELEREQTDIMRDKALAAGEKVNVPLLKFEQQKAQQADDLYYGVVAGTDDKGNKIDRDAYSAQFNDATASPDDTRAFAKTSGDGLFTTSKVVPINLTRGLTIGKVRELAKMLGVGSANELLNKAQLDAEKKGVTVSEILTQLSRDLSKRAK